MVLEQVSPLKLKDVELVLRRSVASQLAGTGSQQYGRNNQTPAMPGGTPRLKRR